jgi:cytochrome c peroxidase
MIGVPSADGGAPTDRGRLDGVERLRRDPFNAAGAFSDQRDGARASVTMATEPDPESWGRFRTPSLRSAASSPPYMHQGQLSSLEDVVRFYDTLEGASALDHHAEQVLQPLGLDQVQRSDLAAFLRAVQGSAPDRARVSDPWPDRPREGAQSDEKPGAGASQNPKSGS